MRGERGSKMSVFVHAQGIETVHPRREGGWGGQKMAKFCPRSCWMTPYYVFRNYFNGWNTPGKDLIDAKWRSNVLSSKCKTFGLGVKVDNREANISSKRQEKVAQVHGDLQQLFDSASLYDYSLSSLCSLNGYQKQERRTVKTKGARGAGFGLFVNPIQAM